MALFEYDQGHLIPAQFGRPVSGGAEEEILRSVRQQVLEVIARPLFPVTWNDIAPGPVVPAGMPAQERPGNTASPRLTALDGSGQVVSIEVIDVLDATTLIAALARLGVTSALGWNELAAAYPGGVAAFRAGWTQFRDSMPPRLEPGPRLILVATTIADDVRPALEALATSGLEVHQISIREMSNGRRFLDVQRVHSSLFSHDPTLLAGRAARIPELTADQAAPSAPALEGAQALAAAGEAAASEPVASEPVASEPVASEPVASEPAEAAPAANVPAEAEPSEAVEEPSVSVEEDSVAVEESSAAAEDHGEAVEESSEAVEEPSEAAAEHGEAAAEEALKPAPVDPQLVQTGSISRRSIIEAARTASPSPVAQEVPEPTGTDFQPVPASPEFAPQVEQEPPAPAALSAHAHRESGSPAQDAEDGPLQHDSEGLRTLIEIVGSQTPLVWVADLDGRQQEVTVLLRLDGTIDLEGESFSDPGAVCRELGHDLGDGWEAWHLGDAQGPTLAEACAEMNAEIRRAEGA